MVRPLSKNVKAKSLLRRQQRAAKRLRDATPPPTVAPAPFWDVSLPYVMLNRPDWQRPGDAADQRANKYGALEREATLGEHWREKPDEPTANDNGSDEKDISGGGIRTGEVEQAERRRNAVGAPRRDPGNLRWAWHPERYPDLRRRAPWPILGPATEWVARRGEGTRAPTPSKPPTREDWPSWDWGNGGGTHRCVKPYGELPERAYTPVVEAVTPERVEEKAADRAAKVRQRKMTAGAPDWPVPESRLYDTPRGWCWPW